MNGPWDKHLPASSQPNTTTRPPAPTTKEDEEPLTITLAGEAARLVRQHARYHELTTDEVVVSSVACACFDHHAFTSVLRFARAFKSGFGR